MPNRQATAEKAANAAPELAAVEPGPRRKGRPLAAERDVEILDATKGLLDEIGYDRLRIQDVADRAHAGLSTIYRRWPTKQALVIAALQRSVAERPPETEDARGDLHASLVDFVNEISGPKCHSIAGFLAALRTDPELAAAFRATVLTEVRDRLRGPIARIVGDGDPQLDMRVDLAPAILSFRLLIGDEPPDSEATVRELEALIVGEHSADKQG